MSKFDLMKAYIERSTGRPISTMQPKPLDGWGAVEALWPLNERFRPNIEQIRSLRYDASFEAEADEAIEQLASDGNWSTVSAGAWRVLLERHQQGIVVALANERAGNPLFSLPDGLTPGQKTVVVALFLLHGMKLPWPPEDRSGFVVPPGAAPASLARH